MFWAAGTQRDQKGACPQGEEAPQETEDEKGTRRDTHFKSDGDTCWGEGVGASLPCGESGRVETRWGRQACYKCADSKVIGLSHGGHVRLVRWVGSTRRHTRGAFAGERCECILDAALILWAGCSSPLVRPGTDRAPPHSFPSTLNLAHTHTSAGSASRPAPSWPGAAAGPRSRLCLAGPGAPG